MNPLGNGNMGGQMPHQMMQGINQVKNLMRMAQGNPMALAQQNPMLGQVMNMCRGQNPQQLFYAMCQQRGVNPDFILNELRKQ